MKLYHLQFLTFVSILFVSAASFAATTIYDYDSDAYKYVNTNSSKDSGGLFTTSSFSSSVKDAYFWEGPSTNISGEDKDFENALNSFFSDNTFSGDGDTSFSFDTAVKTSGDFENPITGPIKGLLLKQAQGSLLVTFNAPVSSLYWNTLFVTQGGTGDDKISHYVLLDAISAVPVPAALWLFAPALFGFIGLRKKTSLN